MRQLIRVGINVARLKSPHVDFSAHKKLIEHLRAASAAERRRVTIMADF
jgi:pyruvate kinase